MQQTEPIIAFEGTDEERRLAEQVFRVARFQGRLFAATAPIRLRRDDLVEFVARQEKREDRDDVAKALDGALRKNPAVFQRLEADDGGVTYVTTRGGTIPVEAAEDTVHTLAERFMTPQAAPPPPPRTVTRIADAWAQRGPFLGTDETLAADGAEAAVDEAAAAEPIAPAAEADDMAIAEAEAPVTPEEAPMPAVPPAAVGAPIVPPDLGAVPEEALRAALVARLEGDDRFVAFGDRYYAEDLVERYSRGEFRRIREYIQEETIPLGDDTLLQDLFNRRPNDPAYEAARFAINYRLSREKREFEFVGTRDSRLWMTPGLPPIGTTLRKASELGQDYRYLLDEPAAGEVGESVTRALTFYEWVYGLLPLDGELREFFPGPYLEDQKTAVLRFEVPQLYVAFLAELRYPTGNRGGYLAGFDEFYRENLVPGALVTIERTPGNDGHYVIRFAPARAREERVLQIDERRNRYVFRPHTVAFEVDDAYLLAESRYPRLANAKPMDDRERRRPELVVGTAFERVGENVGTKQQPRYWSAPDELLPIVNIERPFSLRALREVLESPQYPQFSPDPDTEGAFFYEPPASGKAAPTRKRGARAAAAEDEEPEPDQEQDQADRYAEYEEEFEPE